MIRETGSLSYVKSKGSGPSLTRKGEVDFFVWLVGLFVCFLKRRIAKENECKTTRNQRKAASFLH